MNNNDTLQLFTDMFKKIIPEENSISYDILENDEEIIIYAHIPGILPTDLKIDFFNNKVKILARISPPYNMGNYKYKYIGINYSDKECKIQLPVAITDKEHVKTTIKDGVLSIRIDRTKEVDKFFSISPL